MYVKYRGLYGLFFFFKQKTAYEMRISDWSSDGALPISATLADPLGFRAWLAPGGEADTVELVKGESGAAPEVEVLLPHEAIVPWGGHAGRWAKIGRASRRERVWQYV